MDKVLAQCIWTMSSVMERRRAFLSVAMTTIMALRLILKMLVSNASLVRTALYLLSCTYIVSCTCFCIYNSININSININNVKIFIFF